MTGASQKTGRECISRSEGKKPTASLLQIQNYVFVVAVVGFGDVDVGGARVKVERVAVGGTLGGAAAHNWGLIG